MYRPSQFIMTNPSTNLSGSRPKIAIISGDDDNRLTNFVTPTVVKGCSDLSSILIETGLDVRKLCVTPNYFRKSLRYKLHEYDLVINNVTDPDRNPKCLAVMIKLEHEYGASFLNSPRLIAQIGRDRVAAMAGSIPGIIAPKTLRLIKQDEAAIVRATNATGFRWPGIMRQVGEHAGGSLQIVRNAEETAARRNPREQHYLTEFVNFRSHDGLYRKVRFFVIGGEILLRSMVTGKKWNLHGRDRSDILPGVDPAAEEKRVCDYFAEGRFSRVEGILLELASKLKLDYFGVDCALLSNERILLFEANPTMTFGGGDPKRPHMLTRRPLAVEMASRMIARALKSRANLTHSKRDVLSTADGQCSARTAT
jgi:glutathione synthase/RimK-type ligase-like ATP-grasp enzyme